LEKAGKSASMARVHVLVATRSRLVEAMRCEGADVDRLFAGGDIPKASRANAKAQYYCRTYLVIVMDALSAGKIFVG
jgi:hypothetical protein